MFAASDGDGEEQSRKADEEHVQPAHAELVVDPERGDPDDVGDVLKTVCPGFEVGDVADRQPECDDRADQRDHAGHAPGAALGGRLRLLLGGELERARRGRRGRRAGAARGAGQREECAEQPAGGGQPDED